MPENLGEQFLHKRDSKLHTTQPVEHEVKRRKLRGETVSQKPADKITNWLEVVKRTHTGHRDDERVLERIKEYYHREHVIQENQIPESYFKTQQRIAREQGHGDIVLTPEMRHRLSEVIIADQQTTLDNWVDYLTSIETDHLPTWVKYWVFNGMLQLSTYDKQKHAFAKRGKDTVAPFPDLNREALAYVMDTMMKKVGEENVPVSDSPELHTLLQSANFGGLYAYANEKITPTEEHELLRSDGEWVLYPQYSDHMPLVQSLQGHGTGWCTAGESTAEAQLQAGDFHVYYSYDKDGKPTIPRVAIRMQGSEIAEVRGIAPEQNLDPYIGEVVAQKLNKFPDGKKYQKKSADMKRLTEIDKKVTDGTELTIEDLQFLYEIDSHIEGFGYHDDPRISEILRTRDDIKYDLALISGYTKEQISLTEEEALQNGIKLHYGSLDFNDYDTVDGLILPEIVTGNLSMSTQKKIKNIVFPKRVGQTLSLMGLKSLDGLDLPESVGFNLYLNSLDSITGSRLPRHVGGGIFLNGLTNCEGIVLPESFSSIHLPSIQTTKGLSLPQTVIDDVNLNHLISAEGLQLPELVGGNLSLTFLETTRDLRLPVAVGRDLNLSTLSSAKGLVLPEWVGGDINLSGLLSTEHLVLPKQVGGSVLLYTVSEDEREKLRMERPDIKIQP